VKYQDSPSISINQSVSINSSDRMTESALPQVLRTAFFSLFPVISGIENAGNKSSGSYPSKQAPRHFQNSFQ
jgi:hypothetical protein